MTADWILTKSIRLVLKDRNILLQRCFDHFDKTSIFTDSDLSPGTAVCMIRFLAGQRSCLTHRSSHVKELFALLKSFYHK
jgi:hypothetical protein